MLKKLFLALSLLAGLLSPAFGAGTITMSLTQRFDNSTHLPLSGGLIYFIHGRHNLNAAKRLSGQCVNDPVCQPADAR
jgi:hypothetical protein